MPPQDYYWLWTGEGWGARGDAAKNASQQPHVANSTSPVVQTVLADMLAADAAKKATGANFSLATCGTLDSQRWLCCGPMVIDRSVLYGCMSCDTICRLDVGSARQPFVL